MGTVKQKSKKAKWVALACALSMTATGVLPALGAPEEGGTEPLDNQVLDLEFENDLTDGSALGNPVKASNEAYEFVDGVGGGRAVCLTGSTYLDLGTSEELQPENLTLSFWINPNAPITGEQIISWNKQEYYTDGWYLTMENDNTPLALSVGEGANAG